MVRIEEPVPPEGTKTTGGLNEPEVWAGSPLRNRMTLPLKPFSEVRVTAYCTVPGRTTVRLDGVTLMLKLGARVGAGVFVMVGVPVAVAVSVGITVSVGV
jgi:hypothetical protein